MPGRTKRRPLVYRVCPLKGRTTAACDTVNCVPPAGAQLSATSATSFSRHGSPCHLNQVVVQLSDGFLYTLPPPDAQAASLAADSDPARAEQLQGSRHIAQRPDCMGSAARGGEFPALLRLEQQQLYRYGAPAGTLLHSVL